MSTKHVLNKKQYEYKTCLKKETV